MRQRTFGLSRTVFEVRKVFGVTRILLALLLITALIGDFDYVLGFATFVTSNFFSYFTVQSAIAAVVLFITAAIIALRRSVDPPWLDIARVLVTSYMVVSGIVFLTIVIQSSTRDYTIDVPWSSQLLHFWIPTLALLDWMLDFAKARLGWKPLAWIVVYPLIWGAFTLVRGASVGWYPYFFLDPIQVSGPLETAFYCALALALMTGVAAVLIALTRLRWMPKWMRRAVTATDVSALAVSASDVSAPDVSAPDVSARDLSATGRPARKRPAGRTARGSTTPPS